MAFAAEHCKRRVSTFTVLVRRVVEVWRRGTGVKRYLPQHAVLLLQLVCAQLQLGERVAQLIDLQQTCRQHALGDQV